MRHIHISEVDGKLSVCFDTGLDPRSFARTKMSQCLIERGYIVYPDGTHKVWKASGVNEVNGHMRVWGSPFLGERLDQLLNEIKPATRQAALEAVAYWIRAKMLIGEIPSAPNPGAAFISCADNSEPEYPKGSVFFAPESLSQRCLFVEGAKIDPYNCPDLKGIDAAAFCAGVMLYKILLQKHPYADSANIFQDMREGVFLPPNLADSGLDAKICELLQAALFLPVARKKTTKSGADILAELLSILISKDGVIAEVSSLSREVSEEEEHRITKEKTRYLMKQNITVQSKRFYHRNRPLLIGFACALAFIFFIVVNTTQNRAERPTTTGMSSEAVVLQYYEAFSNLDHTFMEAIIHGGADRGDLNVALNFFVISRMRQAHEGHRPAFISARVWQESGGELPDPNVFGVTDLRIRQIGGSEAAGSVVYIANYLLWFPNELAPSSRTDELTLTRIRGDWRITEIRRTINS